MGKSELEQLVSSIKKNLKQTSINKVDEVNVMRTRLNGKEVTLGVYDKAAGYLGQRSPHEEGVRFIKGILSDATGLDKKDSQHLAENYEWQKRDANFLLNNMRDFISIYTSTGRKMNIMQNADSEANIFTKDIPEGTKSVPDKDNPGKTKMVKTKAYTKLVSQTKCPVYKEDN